MSLFVLPRLDTAYLAEARWGGTSLAAVGGVWAVVVALIAATLTLIALNYRRLPSLRESMDRGANASVLPAFSVASLVGFGAVIAALPAFTLVRDWVIWRRPARLPRRRYQHSRRADRLGLWRPYHRARCAGPDLSPSRFRARH
jgi:hypothetical protein